SDNNIFVAVGDAGAVLTAAEPLQAQSWTNRSTLTSSTLTDVTFGEGLFVAVGGSGALLTSDNGSSWISRVSGSSNDLAAAASGGGQYVVVGPGEILRSSDGAQWTRTFADPNTYFHAVAYGRGTFIAVGTDYSSDPQAGFFDTPIYRSPDGNVWTK